MDTESLITTQTNEIIKLNGLLRVANIERRTAEKEKWSAKHTESILREQNDKLRSENSILWYQTNELKEKLDVSEKERQIAEKTEEFYKKKLSERNKIEKIPSSALKAMCEAWGEMNTIRARCGVPYGPNGYRSDITQEYWDDIMERLDAEVVKATGKGAWLNPVLFKESL